jgi:hypothetical protein
MMSERHPHVYSWFHLEAARKAGQAYERERIIKLLQAWGEEAGCYCCASDAAATDLIQLIKGEQE